jgi:hypothetical protein
VIDSEGLKNKSCILAALTDRYMYYKKSSALARRYDKAYVPWDGVYMIWCNLEIANVNFEDFLEEEKSDEQGWLTYQGVDENCKGMDKRDKKVKKWILLGYV